MRVIRMAVFAGGVMAAVTGCAQDSARDPNQHDRVAEDSYERLATQHVSIADFAADGWVLAIGGGGEGVIGQLKGAQVVAVGISRRELEEAPVGPLKVVMDARDLTSLDESFAAAASFFTLCYISETDHLSRIMSNPAVA